MPALENFVVYREVDPETGHPESVAPVRQVWVSYADDVSFAGRFGEVRKAFIDEGPLRGKTAAVKAVLPSAFESPGMAQEYFRQEVNALVGQSRNCFLPRLLATAEMASGDSKVPCIVMEWLEGQTLAALMSEDPMRLLSACDPSAEYDSGLFEMAREALRCLEGGSDFGLSVKAFEALESMKREKRLSVFWAVGLVGLPLARGLVGLESRRFAHCDVSPSNVIACVDGLRMLDTGCLTSLDSRPRATGTAPFLPPWWADRMAEKQDCRGLDAYALAALVRSLVGGEDEEPPACDFECFLSSSRAPSAAREWGSESREDFAEAFTLLAQSFDRAFLDGMDRFLDHGGDVGQGFAFDLASPAATLERAFASYCKNWRRDVLCALDRVRARRVPARMLVSCPKTIVVVEGELRMEEVYDVWPTKTLALIAHEMVCERGALNWVEESLWNRSSEGSEVEALVEQGDAYRLGLGCEVDFEEAFVRYEKAIEEAGSEAAENDLIGAHTGKVYALLGQGELDERAFYRAANYALDVLKAYPNSIGTNLCALNVVSAFEKHTEITREILDILVESNNDIFSAYAMIGLGRLVQESDPDRFIFLFKKAIAKFEKLDELEFAAMAVKALGDYLLNRDEGRAISFYEKAADLGDANAMNNLASLIEKRDRNRAVTLYERAIEQEETAAMNNLACLIREEDPGRAVALYQRAASMGNACAMSNLAPMVQEECPDRAVSLYECATALLEESGDFGHAAAAMNNLASLIEEKDPKRAADLYERAAGVFEESGDLWRAANALNNLAFLLREKDFDRTVVLCERVIGLLEESGRGGSAASAMLNLASLLHEKDHDRAVALYARAAELADECGKTDIATNAAACLELLVREELRDRVDMDDPFAVNNLAFLIQGGDRDRAVALYKRAILLFEQAGELGSAAVAMNNLARLIEEESCARAAALYDRALTLLEGSGEHDRAAIVMNNLAKIIEDAEPDRARELYEQAVERGNAKAMINLARMIEEEDPVRARELRERAAGLDDE